MKRSFVILIFLITSTVSYSQEVAKHVVTSTGSHVHKTDCDISWIVSSLKTYRKKSNRAIYVQGFFYGANSLRSKKYRSNSRIAHLRVYPNPVESVFTADVSEYEDDKYKLEIVDFNGRVLKSEDADPSLHIMNVNGIEQDRLIVRLINSKDVTIASAQIIVIKEK